MGDKYHSFSALAAENVAGVDYRISTRTAPHRHLVVVAPHGGSIERRTSEIASALAKDDYSLYLFEGMDPNGSFDTLHITSHRFDEPSCIQLVGKFSRVISVHGCTGEGEEIYLGGLDVELRHQLHESLTQAGLATHNEGHKFQGTHSKNICNLGLRKQGVQIEFSDGMRGAPRETLAIEIIRHTLCAANLAVGSD